MKTFEFRIVAGDENVPLEDVIQEGMFVCEATININRMWLRRNPQMACALTCGWIKYDTANKDVVAMVQEIKTAPVLINEGKGLCIELVALDVAIRRNRGERALPMIFHRKNGIFHVVTEVIENGRRIVYDPSKELEDMGHVINGRLTDCGC